jgi:cation:H+ antiporter
MNSLLFHTVLYVICFGLVWFGAGLVVTAIAAMAKSWRVPPFILSFFVLGIFTSLPEITIGAISVINHDPTIFAGNLLGGILVIFLAVIPLLSVVSNGVKMPKSLSFAQIVATLGVVVIPSILVADQKITLIEAVVMIIAYLFLLVFFWFKQSQLTLVAKAKSRKKRLSILDTLRVAAGIVILILGSQQIVNTTLFFADYFAISPFFVSLIVVSLGTNIPEISISLQSVIHKKVEIALADFLGSASANTLLFGFFTLLYGSSFNLPNHFLQRFIFLTLGLGTFFFFARSKNTISRKEGLVMLGIYSIFILTELWVVAD